MFRWFRSARVAELDAALRAMTTACEHAQADARYWREKAEILLDAALFHRGEIRHHVFSSPPPVTPDNGNPFLRAMSALQKTEIESPPLGDGHP